MNETEIITKALGYVENGGQPSEDNIKKGKTGEMKSVFQFTPETWKNYSKQVFGKEVPLTPDAETHVVVKKVDDWIKKGYTAQQIFSMWNAGVGEPNAYMGHFSDGSSSKGTNRKFGVQYDVPEYVKKGMELVQKFSNGRDEKNQPIQNSQPGEPSGVYGSNPHDEVIKNLMGIISQTKNVPQKKDLSKLQETKEGLLAKIRPKATGAMIETP